MARGRSAEEGLGVVDASAPRDRFQWWDMSYMYILRIGLIDHIS